MSINARPKSGPLFPPRRIVGVAVEFLGVLLLAWGLSQGVTFLYKLAGVPEPNAATEIPSKWPLSLVQTKLSTRLPGVLGFPDDLCIAAGILLLFLVLLHWLFRQITGNLLGVLLVGLVFVLCTNLIHGPWYGLVYPHQGLAEGDEGALQYYHDAVKITSAAGFLREFEGVQRSLGCHSRTHPPGAVLFFYALVNSVGHGAAVSVAIAAVAVGLSGIFLYGALRPDFPPELCNYVVLLFLLMPAIEVYYCASLDAVIASCCLGVLLLLRVTNRPLCIAGMIGCLFCASFLTFAACFLVPVMVGFESLTRRSVRRSAAVVLGVGVLYLAVYFLCGFNYLESLRTASALENSGGFLLLTRPVTYLITRLENVGDILVFFGPFLLVLFTGGLRTMRGGACPELATLTGLGIATLLAMFLTGAFRTGETARACLFIYPYLMFPVAAYLHRFLSISRCPAADKKLLLGLVFGQTLAMQTLAGYYW